MTKTARLLAVLLMLAAIISLGSLTIGAAATHPTDSDSGNPPAAEAESEVSVRCLPFGLYGEITGEALVDRLSDSSEELIFLGTSNGLYVLGLDGKLRHFLYSPFGVRFVALIDDITGDGSREVVVVLNDTQVPALRCYDGITWEKLWQFAPMFKIWDDVWVKRQLGISGLEVTRIGDSQSLVVTSDRCVFSVNTEDGTERWRFRAPSKLWSMATVADLNNDDADEVFVGSYNGDLFLLNGKTGDTRWRTKLPVVSVQGGEEPNVVYDIRTLDREEGKTAVVSTDGLVRLYDLRSRKCEWAVPLSDERASGFRITLAPDATSDGLPGMLVTYSSGYNPTEAGEEGVVLLDASGEKAWDRKLNVWHHSGVEVGSFGGKPVILEPRSQDIRLTDVKDGQTVVKAIPVSTLDDKAPVVQQIGEDRFLLVSSGSDLAVVSASGGILGTYPRVTNVKALSGAFVGDTTEDILFSCGWKTSIQYGYTPPVNEDGIVLATAGPTYPSQLQGEEGGVRMLKVMDGATREIVWSHEVPLGDLKNSDGLKGIEVTADLVGSDNVPDVIGYCDDTIFIFSGKTGAPFSFSVWQPIVSLDVIRYGVSGNAIAVATAGGLTVFDSAGAELWTTTGTEWVEDENVKFTVLDDVNSDNVSDLAVLSSTGIAILKSLTATDNYEMHLAFNPEAGASIEYVELLPDANGDGTTDLAYIQRTPAIQQQGQYTPQGCPLLLVRSPVDGKELMRVALPARSPAIDLACGDFNGDGCSDSLICWSSYDACGSTSYDPRNYSQGPAMDFRILSGKNGETIWTYNPPASLSYSQSGWNTRPPVTVVGDMNGDGKDDLAWSMESSSQQYSGYYRQQQRVTTYDVAGNRPIKEIPVTPLLRGDSYDYRTSADASILKAYTGADGRVLMTIKSTEPWRPVYDQEPFGPVVYGDYLAVLDAESGQRLAAFQGIDPANASLFESRQSGVLRVAAGGGIYFLILNSGLEVTSPDSGAKTGPVVGVRWEGTGEGDFVQVFVDGVRNHTGNDSGVDLYLARGEHDVVAWSIDDNGRISYSPSDLESPLTVKVTPSPWKPVLLVVSLFALLVAMALLMYARLHRMWRARHRGANS